MDVVCSLYSVSSVVIPIGALDHVESRFPSYNGELINSKYPFWDLQTISGRKDGSL